MKQCSKFQLGFCMGLYGLSVVLMMFSVVRSGFLLAWPVEIAETVLFCGLVIPGVYAAGVPFGKLLLATSGMMLAAGNLSQALMWYACADDGETARIMQVLTGRHISMYLLGIAGCWAAVRFADWFSGNYPLAETVFAVLGGIGLGGYICAAGGKGSNTSAVRGFQPAIIAFFLGLALVTLSLNRAELPYRPKQRENIPPKTRTAQTISEGIAFLRGNAPKYICRFAHLGAALVLAGALFIRHETGIPLLCGLACLAAYWLIYPSPKFSTILWLGILGFAALTIIFLTCDGVRTDTLRKVQERSTSAEIDQISAVIRNLKTAGILGNPYYTAKVPAASSDFALANSTHFWGIGWLLTVSFAVLLGTVKTLFGERPHGFGFAALFPGFCVCAYCILFAWNLGMSFQCCPLIGVQAPFCGTSGSMALLSGLLLGGISAPDPAALKQRAAENTVLRFLWKEFVAS